MQCNQYSSLHGIVGDGTLLCSAEHTTRSLDNLSILKTKTDYAPPPPPPILIAHRFSFALPIRLYLAALDGALLACLPSCCLISSEAALLRMLSTVLWC